MTTVLDIKVASNGYVCTSEDNWGKETISIHSTLLDLAAHVGETYPVPQSAFPDEKEYVRYADNVSYPVERLRDVRELVRNRRKIDAIKLLRSMFTHTIGLKEAKDIVEILVGGD